MKTVLPFLRSQLRALRAGPWLACGAALAAFPALAAESAPKEEAPPEFTNWMTLTVGGAFVEGNPAAFSQRHRLENTAYGGIEDFHYEQDVGKRGLFRVDGRALYDLNDYSIRLELSDPEVGYIRTGYSEFRSWYDGSGGYYPTATGGVWLEPYDDELTLDRGEFYFDAGLTLPDRPVITLHYGMSFRNGRKDSTVWGDNAVPGSTANRGFAPTFLDIDEVRHSLAADVKHVVGKTDLGLGFQYDNIDINNSKNILRLPTDPARNRYVTQREGVDTDMFNVHGFSETRFNDQVWLTLGGAYTKLDTDLSGSRIYGAGYDSIYDPTFARRQQRDEGFYNLTGGSKLSEYLANINLMWLPFDGFSVIPSMRFEKQDLESVSDFVESNVATGGVATQEELMSNSQRDLIDLAGTLDLRYNKLNNWVFYAKGEWITGTGDQAERETVFATGTTDLLRNTDFDREVQKYTAGTYWYPCRQASFSFQYYYKTREDEFDHIEDNTPNRSGNRYPAFLIANDFKTHDVNARVTLRLVKNLSLVSRYDFQQSKIDMAGQDLSAVESSDHTSHIFSQSISWTPWSRLYIQASASWVSDEMDTPASDLGGASTGMVPDADNDYWNLSLMTGFVISDKTDLQATYSYYRADNYANNASVSMPYGANMQDYAIGAALIHRLRDNLRLTVRYGYYLSQDYAVGHQNDYEAHMVSSSLQFLF